MSTLPYRALRQRSNENLLDGADVEVCTKKTPWTLVRPTVEVCTALQGAFDHFNLELFANRLPPCLIRLQRANRSTLGYFHSNEFTTLAGDAKVDGITINSRHILTRTPKDVASTLVHEMCHFAQRCFGKPSRGNYHNREFASLMKAAGLWPSHTGEPGGKETGSSMSHYVVPGGPFAESFARFIQSGTVLSWGDALGDDRPSAPPKRVTFECLICGQTAQAVPRARIDCHDCQLLMTVRCP